MPLRVFVGEHAAAYRAGLVVAMNEHGFICEAPDDVIEWCSDEDCRAALLTIRSADDWERLRRLAELEPRPITVALIVDPTPDRHAEALRQGANAAIAWESDPQMIAQVLRCAVEGFTLLKTDVARSVAHSAAPPRDPGWLTEEEIRWLQILADGATTLELAETIGYSERAVYRALHALYGRMRVSNRREAILQAERWGLLQKRDSSGT